MALSKLVFVLVFFGVLHQLTNCQEEGLPGHRRETNDDHDHNGKYGHHGDGHHGDHNHSNNILLLTLPVTILSTAIIIILLIVVYIVYKARFGEFCCMKPKMRYQPATFNCDFDDIEGDTTSVVNPSADNPPDYSYVYTPKETVGPPVYYDAMQDRVTETGHSPDTTVDPSLPSYYTSKENQVCDTERISQNITEEETSDEQTSGDTQPILS